MLVIEFPESVTVQVSPGTRLVTVQVVLCGLPSYLHDVGPQLSTTTIGFILNVCVSVPVKFPIPVAVIIALFAVVNIIPNLQKEEASIRNVEINRLPKNNQKLLVETWAVFKKPEIITSREFEIKDEEGNVFIHACERLVYEDLQNGKLVRITPEMMGNYNPEPELQHKFRFAKLKEPAVYDREKPLAVRITDIDFNDHVHNTVYFDYALDMLENTQEFISGFRILYKKPLMYKDAAMVKIANTDGGCTVGIYKEDVLCTLVEIRK